MRRSILGMMACASVACAPEEPEASSDDQATALPTDPEACGVRCGEGPLYVIDRLEFLQPVDGVVDGFDLNGSGGAGDCGVADLVAPDGTPGINNQFGAVLSVLPSTVEAILPDAIQQSILTGSMSVLIEVVGIPSLADDGDVAVVLRRGGGVPVLHGEGLAPGQTFGIDPDPLLGFADQGRVESGRLSTEPFSMELRFSFIGTPVQFGLTQARLTFEERSDGVIEGLIGGMVTLDDIEDVLSLLGGDDAALRDTLRALVPNLVDVRSEPGGECDAISAALRLRGVEAFVVDEVIAPPERDEYDEYDSAEG